MKYRYNPDRDQHQEDWYDALEDMGRPPEGYRSPYTRRRRNLAVMIVFFLTLIAIFGGAALVR